jgi:AcrR family transcriptional regulator
MKETVMTSQPPGSKKAKVGRPRTRPLARKPATPREERAAERRQAILDAALAEFSASGFEATRLDDVARRAGVAKGTLYLYFRDKETMFQELVRSALRPIVDVTIASPPPGMKLRDLAEMLLGTFVREVLNTQRKTIIRLVLAEGPRFPKLAEFYWREVLSRAVPALSATIANAIDDNETRHRALTQFPQLLVAPGLVAILWGSLFDRFAPLDAQALLRAHLDALFGERTQS